MVTEKGARTITRAQAASARLAYGQLKLLVERGRATGMKPFLRDPYVMIALRSALAGRNSYGRR